MIRIMRAEEPARTMITIEGQLSSDYVEAVENCCNQAISNGKLVQVLLRDVLTIDDSGRALLRRLAAKGVRLGATGVYTSHLLESIGPAGAGRPRAGSPRGVPVGRRRGGKHDRERD